LKEEQAEDVGHINLKLNCNEEHHIFHDKLFAQLRVFLQYFSSKNIKDVHILEMTCQNTMTKAYNSLLVAMP
jgi:pantothenate kinase-related protein Tda10